MDNVQLENIILADPISSKYFRGIYPADALPSLDDLELREGYVVMNTDVSSGLGLHWTVIYRNRGGSFEFWDSIGHPPEFYGRFFKNFFKAKEYTYATKAVQGANYTCGPFCIYYAYLKCRGYSLDDILHSLSNDNSYNDYYVVDFIERHFHV